MAQVVKNLPVIHETQIQSLGQEDPLEKEMAIHSSILAWRIPRLDREDCQATDHGVTKSRTQLTTHACTVSILTINNSMPMYYCF